MIKLFTKKNWIKVTAFAVLISLSGLAHAQYCIPEYTTGTADNDFIDGVVVNTISNTATGGSISGVGYSDYTALSTDLTAGSSYSITMTNNPSWGESYTAWIDYNMDLAFSVDEVIASAGLSFGGSTTVSFTVPVTALSGSAILRVRCAYPSGLVLPIDPCILYTYGEAEDYTVNISGGIASDIGVSAVTSPVSAAFLGAENITVTVSNYAINDASGFSVKYSVDGGPTVSESYPGTLAAGSSASFTFTAAYDFTADVCYSINAYTNWESDEYAGDDGVTQEVCNYDIGPITGSNAYYINSNAVFGEPWGSTSNLDAMDAAIGVGAWTHAYYETLEFGSVFSPSTCFVFLEGSDGHADELEAFLDANYLDIEAWVSSGGHLLLNAAPNEGDGMNFHFGGMSLFYAYYTGSASPIDAAHPIYTGPFTPVSTTITGSSFAHALVVGDASPIISETGITSNVVLSEKAWGDGRVVFGGMTTANFHSPTPDGQNLRNNIIAYLYCAGAEETCPVPTGLYADGITASAATFHWDNMDVSQYTCGIWNISAGAVSKRHLAGTSLSATHLSPSTTYAFRVKSSCTELDMRSDYSEWYYFTTAPGRLGEFGEGVSLYPNPSNGQFTLQLDGFENTKTNVSIISMLGQEVYTNSFDVTSTTFTENINLDAVANGMYQVRIAANEKIDTYTISIQK